MSTRLVRLAAWSCLLAVAIATVVPIEMRPETALTASSERVTAFAIIGLLFAVAYPRKLWFAILVAVGAAVALEVIQLLIPSRHGRMFDATVKVAGASAGLLIGYLAQILFSMRFVVQWIASERAGRSVVPTAFWVFSIGGGVMLLGYAIYRKDPVFIIGQAFGVFVYVRNLQFVLRSGGASAI